MACDPIVVYKTKQAMASLKGDIFLKFHPFIAMIKYLVFMHINPLEICF